MKPAVLAVALALVSLGAAPAPRMNSAVSHGALDIKTLSVHDKLTLPPDTKVRYGKRTITLGRLRANHAALVASRNHVRTLRFSTVRAIAPGAAFNKVIGLGGVSAQGGVPRASMNGFAADYRQFCNSMPANVCLYYPPNVSWFTRDGNGNYQTIDELVTDPGVCAQEGGTIGSLNDGWIVTGTGCIYTYPASQTVNFVPPKTGYTTTGWCNVSGGHFSTQTDPRGAVRVSDAGASGWVTQTYAPSGGQTPSVEQFCFLQVKLSH